ncbi:hypothetical protein F4810DRAFT_618286 [Camillea tinctor]|nr:hypothetical protein F4810DRAFT_618286 [Camillea tinctor]
MKGMWCLEPRCKLKGCKQRRVRGSDYCQIHVCSEWLHNRHCLKRGRGPGGLCAEHSTCVKIHHGRKCGNRRKKIDTEYKYCADLHACRDDECKAPNVGNRTATVISKWCVNHACANTECDGPRIGGGQGCKAHTCQAAGCVLTVPGTKDADKSKVDNYCAQHRTCKKAACDQPIFVHNANRSSRFCFEHYCKPGSGACEKERIDGAGAEACEDHTCARYHLARGCCKPRAAGTLPGALYCADHECKRVACQRERYADKDWCPEHLCNSPLELREDCGNEREGAAANQIYCKDHRLCAEPKCREFRAFKGNVRQEKCEEHSKPPCKFPSCTRNPSTEGVDYCPAHLCQYAHGCRSPPVAGSPVCWVHKCVEASCPFPRVVPPPADIPFPFYPATAPAAADATAMLFYQHHLAAVMGSAGSYCHLHTCRARGCGEFYPPPPFPLPPLLRG